MITRIAGGTAPAGPTATSEPDRGFADVMRGLTARREPRSETQRPSTAAATPARDDAARDVAGRDVAARDDAAGCDASTSDGRGAGTDPVADRSDVPGPDRASRDGAAVSRRHAGRIPQDAAEEAALDVLSAGLAAAGVALGSAPSGAAASPAQPAVGSAASTVAGDGERAPADTPTLSDAPTVPIDGAAGADEAPAGLTPSAATAEPATPSDDSSTRAVAQSSDDALAVDTVGSDTVGTDAAGSDSSDSAAAGSHAAGPRAPEGDLARAGSGPGTPADDGVSAPPPATTADRTAGDGDATATAQTDVPAAAAARTSSPGAADHVAVGPDVHTEPGPTGPTSVRDSSAGLATRGGAAVDRVSQVAEALRAAPAPRAVTLDLDPLGGGRVIVRVTGDVVSVTPAAGSSMGDGAFADDLARGLAERGMQLAGSGDGRTRDHRRDGGQRPASAVLGADDDHRAERSRTGQRRTGLRL